MSSSTASSLSEVLQCPICQGSMASLTRGYDCERGHHFDLAKEGYVNLLPVQKKNSKEPGDSREQLRARQQFLEQGHYDILRDQLVALVGGTTGCLIDLGAGEGYFTRQMSQTLGNGCSVIGVDVAKEGMRLAAQANRRQALSGHYVVASNFDVPCRAQSADCIVRIFAPSQDQELARLLKPSGRLIIVAPAADHLRGLRQTIYREVLDHEPPATPQGFMLERQHQVVGGITLDAAHDIDALLAMTPFSWRMSESAKSAVANQLFKDVIAFDFFEYRLSQ